MLPHPDAVWSDTRETLALGHRDKAWAQHPGLSSQGKERPGAVCPCSLARCCIRSPAYETWVRWRGELCSGVERPPEGATRVVWCQLGVQHPGWMLPVWKKAPPFPSS